MKFTSKAELKTHYSRDHSMTKCHVCPESTPEFSSVDELKEHAKDAHRSMKCVYCQKRFPEEAALKDHYDNKHCVRTPRRPNRATGKYDCKFPSCNQKAFPHARDLLDHIDAYHTPREVGESRKGKEKRKKKKP